MADDIKRIEQLPAEERFEAYSNLVAHYTKYSALAFTDGTKQMFTEMAREMKARADAVTVWRVA